MGEGGSPCHTVPFQAAVSLISFQLSNLKDMFLLNFKIDFLSLWELTALTLSSLRTTHPELLWATDDLVGVNLEQ